MHIPTGTVVRVDLIVQGMTNVDVWDTGVLLSISPNEISISRFGISPPIKWSKTQVKSVSIEKEKTK
jgi:hypothetical protein